MQGLSRPLDALKILTPVLPFPPIQLLEGGTLQWHRLGGEGSEDYLWPHCPQYDLSCRTVDVPSLTAQGSVPGPSLACASGTTGAELGLGRGRASGASCCGCL
ncbi:rCG30773 [Rattus norvegicus]|uniref:RCG30773 n=1 Tax=Rattus norvegicus TaxID=10116 RepID=A6ITL6_RAT|nr:rCG30773 [Rattus norvegicus]